MHSEALSIREIRSVDRTVGECLELGNDLVAWQTHALAAGAKLLNLPVGLCAELVDFDLGTKPQIVGALDHGWPTESQRRAFFNSPAPNGPEPFGVSPLDLRFRGELRHRRGVTRVRSDLMGDADWHRQPIYCDVHRPAGMDEVAYSAVRLDARRVSVLAFGGADARPGGRQRRALALLHHQLASLLGHRLTSWSSPGRHRLTPRQQEVFDLLLSDCSEKEIVQRLDRSRSTITAQIAAVYRSFGVRSRAQLLLRVGRSASPPTT